MIIGLAIFAQLLAAQTLWGHQSDNGVILGRYSARYSLVLAEYVVVTMAWLAAFAVRHRLVAWIQNRPALHQLLMVAVPALPVAALWFLPIEDQIKDYTGMNWLLWALLVSAASVAHSRARIPYGRWLLAAGMAMVLVLLLLTVLTRFPFSPDEAHWADYASTAIVGEGIYARTWLMTPTVISPGLGWSVAAYGWVLEHVAFDIRTGRVWDYAGDLLAIVGVGLLAGQLYGRRAALAGMAFACLSRAFFPVFDYRPDHQLAFAASFVLLAAVVARRSPRPAVQHGAHLACGFLATLSMQLHAAAIAFAVGMSAFYLVEWWVRGRNRAANRAATAALLWFGAGAALGTAVFLVWNVLPAGGLETYLTILLETRTQRQATLQFLTWPSLLEGMLIVGAFAFLIWRRSASDRLYLGLLLSILIALLLFDTQGYRSPVIALYSVAVGAFLTQAFPAEASEQRYPLGGLLAVASVAGIMLAQTLAFVNWGAVGEGLRTGAFPNYAYQDLRPLIAPYLRDDDTIVSTHLLIWTVPEKHLISTAGELTAMREWNLTDPADVWERVQPTVIVDIPEQMTIGPGLRTYMQEHAFLLCDQLTVQHLEILVYRPACSGAL